MSAGHDGVTKLGYKPCAVRGTEPASPEARTATSQPPTEAARRRLKHRELFVLRFRRFYCMAVTAIGLLGPGSQVAMAATDTELLMSCRGVLAATEPATRRIWLERDLFAYELHAAVGSSSDEMRIYRANLRDTCSRVDHNNHLLRMRSQQARVVWRPAS